MQNAFASFTFFFLFVQNPVRNNQKRSKHRFPTETLKSLNSIITPEVKNHINSKHKSIQYKTPLINSAYTKLKDKLRDIIKSFKVCLHDLKISINAKITVQKPEIFTCKF